ncbi:MAG: DUF3667 domain-containing protein [Chitinophagaceae bacterium]
MQETAVDKNIRECPGCHKPGEGIFCMHCGEKMKPEIITVRNLLSQIPDLLDIDHGLFYTIRTMFYRPGRALRRYFAGDRVRHYKPIKYVLFLGTISTIIMAYVAQYEGPQETLYTDNFRGGEGMDKLLNEWNTVWLMLGFPLLALVSWKLFAKRPYTLGEHIVANAFLMGQYAFVSILINPLFMLENETLALNVSQLVMWLLFFYYVYAFYDWFYGLRTFMGLLKSLGAVILCFMVLFIGILFIVPIVYYIKQAFGG